MLPLHRSSTELYTSARIRPTFALKWESCVAFLSRKLSGSHLHINNELRSWHAPALKAKTFASPIFLRLNLSLLSPCVLLSSFTSYVSSFFSAFSSKASAPHVVNSGATLLLFFYFLFTYLVLLCFFLFFSEVNVKPVFVLRIVNLSVRRHRIENRLLLTESVCNCLFA